MRHDETTCRCGETLRPTGHFEHSWCPICDRPAVQVKADRVQRRKAAAARATCPDCKATNQRGQFCRWCAQHFGPNTNRPTGKPSIWALHIGATGGR